MPRPDTNPNPGDIGRLERLWALWNQEAQGMKQPFRSQFQNTNDPLQAIMQLQQGYGQQVPQDMLMRLLQLGQGISEQHGMPDPAIMQLLQALMSQPQRR